MDEEDDIKPPRHWGDFGALFLAGGFSLFGLYLIVDMISGGHPLGILFQKPPAQTQQVQVPSEEEQRAAPFNAQPGEVVLSTKTMKPVSAPKKPQDPKKPVPRP